MLHKRKDMNTIHAAATSLHTNTIITSPSSYSNRKLSIQEYKSQLKCHMSSQGYKDLESHWKFLGID